ncbi:hypothetical protein BH11ACT8_BH11ACT8_00610 [soil metagenome]
MSYFSSAVEVDCFVGGLLRMAAVDPQAGPLLAAASLTLTLRCEDPDASLTISMFDPVTVFWNVSTQVPDVELACRADLLDRYLRGQFSLLDGLADGRVQARGRVSKVLKVLPALEPLFPVYRRLVAAKDRADRGAAALAAH